VEINDRWCRSALDRMFEGPPVGVIVQARYYEAAYTDTVPSRLVVDRRRLNLTVPPLVFRQRTHVSRGSLPGPRCIPTRSVCRVDRCHEKLWLNKIWQAWCGQTS
jgi:hypothetical protein